MNEKDFSEKLRPWLERSADQVGDLQATGLKAARLRALAAYREPVRVLGLVTVGNATAQTLRYSVFQRSLLWLPVIALVAILAFQSTTGDLDLGELDAQLLTQELPPDAFLDKDFRNWLGKPAG